MVNKKKILIIVVWLVVTALVFNFSLFLGLQVSTVLGSFGLVATALLLGGFIWYLAK